MKIPSELDVDQGTEDTEKTNSKRETNRRDSELGFKTKTEFSESSVGWKLYVYRVLIVAEII